MDQLATLLNVASQQIMPILSAIVLILVIIFMVYLISLIKEITKRIIQLEPTLRNVDISLEKAQAPLDTCVNLSHSVDQIHENGEKALKSCVEYTSTQFANIKKQYDEKKQYAEKMHEMKNEQNTFNSDINQEEI